MNKNKVKTAKKKQQWTAEWDRYLMRMYPNNPTDKLLSGLRRKGYKGSADQMNWHANRTLHLRKSPEFHAAERQRCIKLCLQNRPADFAERQRQRALSGGWWGGKHKNGNNLTREERSAMARRNLHTGDVAARAQETRRKAIARDRRRVSIGLPPKTRIINENGPLTQKQQISRYMMARECGYIIFRGDQRIYYDENTRRSEKREATAESRGLFVYPLCERKKFEINEL